MEVRLKAEKSVDAITVLSNYKTETAGTQSMF